jgi:hypothetical protein
MSHPLQNRKVKREERESTGWECPLVSRQLYTHGGTGDAKWRGDVGPRWNVAPWAQEDETNGRVGDLERKNNGQYSVVNAVELMGLGGRDRHTVGIRPACGARKGIGDGVVCLPMKQTRIGPPRPASSRWQCKLGPHLADSQLPVYNGQHSVSDEGILYWSTATVAKLYLLPSSQSTMHGHLGVELKRHRGWGASRPLSWRCAPPCGCCLRETNGASSTFMQERTSHSTCPVQQC